MFLCNKSKKKFFNTDFLENEKLCEKIDNDDGDEELFLQYGWPTKSV